MRTVIRRDFRTLFVFTILAWALAGATIPLAALVTVTQPAVAFILAFNVGGATLALPVLTAIAWVGEIDTVHVHGDPR